MLLSLCGQDQISWFDVRNIPSEIDLMTEEEWDNYDPSQENADAIIDIGMWNKGKDAEKTVNSDSFDRKMSVLRKFYIKCFVVQNKHITFVA